MNQIVKRTISIATIVLTLLLALTVFTSAIAHKKVTQEEFTFHSAMRKLWEDHITWTRLYIVSTFAELPDKELTAQRLLQNQDDIGNAIKPFYGAAAGDHLSVLLREHILTAAELLEFAKAGDTEALEEAKTRWYNNGNEIAAFLNSANPDNWPLGDMQAMMKSHLDLTLEEASARLNGDWEADIAAFDEIHEQILEMADMLSMGIIHQFPKQFK